MNQNLSNKLPKLDEFEFSLNSGSEFKFESAGSNYSSSDISELRTPVLGRFTGIFAKLDSMSTNGRFYSKRFWISVLNSERVRFFLQTGRMIGIFEHPESKGNYTEDGLLTARHPANGAFIVKRLWIEGNNVMGEAYLLNTPLGRILATYFLAKDKSGKPLVELYISARGYSEKDYFDTAGIDQMNPDDYFLQSFDVVMNPGIKGARVKMESRKICDSIECFIRSKSESAGEENVRRFRGLSILNSKEADSLRKELNLKSI